MPRTLKTEAGSTVTFDNLQVRPDLPLANGRRSSYLFRLRRSWRVMSKIHPTKEDT
jgi:hypothetical protein